ncbi:hypothetical protein [Nonomuraea sp. NPDC048916]|uniref:hypothetical protein n=1 Tax=Nonomuraea sp. NPDC048916 TaxID=3154232 RepID=UPI003404F700
MRLFKKSLTFTVEVHVSTKTKPVAPFANKANVHVTRVRAYLKGPAVAGTGPRLPRTQ